MNRNNKDRFIQKKIDQLIVRTCRHLPQPEGQAMNLEQLCAYWSKKINPN